MNEYLFCIWHHDHANEPTEFYWEVGADRAVLRLVERFRDGTLERDTLPELKLREPTYVGDSLHDGPMPSLDEIQAEEARQSGPDRTETIAISAERFEAVFDIASPRT